AHRHGRRRRSALRRRRRRIDRVGRHSRRRRRQADGRLLPRRARDSLVTRSIRTADVDVQPVTAETWDDFARLFEAKGSPHYCWCTPFRVRGSADLTSAQKKQVARRLVDASTPIGVLAYAGGEPVGWCSIAPRESYVRLEKSRAMPRATPPATSTWTILCFFVARSH